MSDKRELPQIQQDYTQAMARIGEIDYLSQDSFPLERTELVKKVRKLEQEAKQLQKAKTAEAKKEEHPEAKPEETEPQNDNV